MAIKSFSFESKVQLIEELKSTRTQKIADDFYTKEQPLTVIIKKCVQGNTFRAFHKKYNDNKPSEVFRNWCESYFTDGNIYELVKARDKYQYQSLIDKAVGEFRQYWNSKMGYEIDYGRAAKLLNLFFKWLACYDKLLKAEKDKLITLQHVPLDSYTIVGLKNIAPDLNIKSNDSMSSIGDAERYLQFQNLISEIAAEAKTPAIYYDFVAYPDAK